MREHISPDEFWLSLARLRDGGWTDQEIIEQVKNVALLACKRWLVRRGYIQEEDDPLHEYIHLHFMETLEDEAVVDALRALDNLDSKLYIDKNPFSLAVESMRVVAALSYVGFSTEDLLSQEEAKRRVKAHLDKNRPDSKVNEALQEVIDELVDEGDSFADFQKTIRSITEPVEGIPDCDEYFCETHQDDKTGKEFECFCWKDGEGRDDYRRLTSLRPYYRRAIEKK